MVSWQMEAIVLTILETFFATPAALKIGDVTRTFPSFGWVLFSHLTRLDQLRVSKNV